MWVHARLLLSALAIGIASPAPAQDAPSASSPLAPERDESSSQTPAASGNEPGAPAFIKGRGGSMSVDPDQDAVIIDTDGQNPTSGESQEVKCPGGQVLTQAQGNPRGIDCQ